jgi:hypothetical protein
MTLSTSLGGLVTSMHMLRDSLLEVRMTSLEDMPESGRHQSLGARIGDRIELLGGWLEEALTSAREANGPGSSITSVEASRGALFAAHESFNRVSREFTSELGTYSLAEDLAGLVHSPSNEWAGWAKTVVIGLERCRNLLNDVNDHLLECWEGLAQQSSCLSAPVNATSVGQKTSVRR